MAKFTAITEQQEALGTYLQDMLTEAKTSVAVEPAIEQPIIRPHQPLPPTTEAIESVIETWHQAPFQALLIEIHGLKIAVPIIQLDGILKQPATPLAKMAGKPSWHLGLIADHKQYTQVIDIAHIVLPEESYADKQLTYIILIDNKRWGLACHQVSKVITLSPDQVEWHPKSAKQPWLVGTVIESMYNLIDMTEFAKLLNNE